MFGSKSKDRVTLNAVHHHTLARSPELEFVLNSIEPESAPPAPVMAVMERAKAAITTFDNDSDVEKLNYEIARLSRESCMLFGLESHAAAALSTKVDELQREERVARAFEKFGGQKLRLSNEVLTWRKTSPALLAKFAIPLPEVALFGLDQNTVRISASWPHMGEMNPSLPHSLMNLYEDVWSQLGSISSSGGFHRNVGIVAAFTGVIPLETKAKIREAETSGVFSDIRVLAETEWAVNVVPIPFYADPIVVGLVGDEMWVIDIFDPTSLEDYIAREFTTG